MTDKKIPTYWFESDGTNAKQMSVLNPKIIDVNDVLRACLAISGFDVVLLANSAEHGSDLKKLILVRYPDIAARVKIDGCWPKHS
jgi:hypothetical protein